MPRIEVEESALEAIKAMAQRLQEERDELLGLMQDVNNMLIVCGDIQDSSPVHSEIKRVIAKCTAEPKVLE